LLCGFSGGNTCQTGELALNLENKTA